MWECDVSMNTRSRVTFFTISKKSVYDPELGEMTNPILRKSTVACDVSETGIDRSHQLFGEYKKGGLTVHLLRPYKGEADYLIYQGQRYKIIGSRLNGAVFYIQRDLSIGGSNGNR